MTLTSPQHTKLTAALSPNISSFLKEKEKIHHIMQEHQHGGPVHVLFPKHMKYNIEDFKTTLDALDVPYALYVSHKPTKSQAFLKEAFYNKAGIDVSSANELSSALGAGIPAKDICCTGVKDDGYLLLSLQHGCLHSIDSLEELNRYCFLKNRYNLTQEHRILLRLSSVETEGRRFARLPSRFGLSVEQLEEAYACIRTMNTLCFSGFHIHNDEPSPDVKAETILTLIRLMKEAYTLGFSPTLIDIGGGFVRNPYAAPAEGAAFIQMLQTALIHGSETHTWHKASYGMTLHGQGRVTGLKGLSDKFERKDFTHTLSTLLNYADEEGETVAHKLADCGFTLMLEPGRACLEQCGITLMRVIETKKAPSGDMLTILQGHSLNLSLFPNDPYVDPFLIEVPKKASEIKDSSNSPFSTYLMGNMCMETDILTRRKIEFHQQPKPGDIIAFPNTAAYVSGFWEASPHLHPQGKRILIGRQNNQWTVCEEHTYLPHQFEE